MELAYLNLLIRMFMRDSLLKTIFMARELIDTTMVMFLKACSRVGSVKAREK